MPSDLSVPGRIHITWQDDTTIKVDTDAGTQTRLLRFDVKTPTEGPRTWQGVSIAQWLTPRPNVPLQLRPADRAADTPDVRPTGGSLRVVTRNLRAGYLRKNGVPYSENAVMTETRKASHTSGSRCDASIAAARDRTKSSRS